MFNLLAPDPGRKMMAATEALATEVLPAIVSDHHLKQMLLRLKHLVLEGEGWAAREERRLVNSQIAMIVTHYFERQKVRRINIEARHHVGPSSTRIFISVFHGRTEATRTLEIPNE